MRLGKLWCLIAVIFTVICLTDCKPFMMAMGQALSGALFSVWKLIDNTPPPQNRTTMKRAPAFASKYSISQSIESTPTK